MTQRALVCDAGGFIGSHLVKRLKREGYWVRGVDLKTSEFSVSPADQFIIGDLREQAFARSVIDPSPLTRFISSPPIWVGRTCIHRDA